MSARARMLTSIELRDDDDQRMGGARYSSRSGWLWSCAQCSAANAPGKASPSPNKGRGPAGRAHREAAPMSALTLADVVIAVLLGVALGAIVAAFVEGRGRR